MMARIKAVPLGRPFAKPVEKREPGTEVFRRHFPQARCFWQVEVKHVGKVEMFLLGNHLLIVQEYDNRNGWNVFSVVTENNRIDATIEAIAKLTGQPSAI